MTYLDIFNELKKTAAVKGLSLLKSIGNKTVKNAVNKPIKFTGKFPIQSKQLKIKKQPMVTIGSDTFKKGYGDSDITKGFNTLSSLRKDLALAGRLISTLNKAQILKKYLNKLDNDYDFQDAINTLNKGDFNSAFRKFDLSVISLVMGLKDKTGVVIPSNILRYLYPDAFRKYVHMDHPIGIVAKSGNNKYSLVFNPNDALKLASSMKGASSFLEGYTGLTNTDNMLNTLLLSSLRSVNTRQFGHAGIPSPRVNWLSTTNYFIYPKGRGFTPVEKARYIKLLEYGHKRDAFIRSLKAKGMSYEDINKLLYLWLKLNGSIDMKNDFKSIGNIRRYGAHSHNPLKFSGISYVAPQPLFDKALYGHRRYSLADTLDDIYQETDFDIYAPNAQRILNQLKATKVTAD